jgi:type I restriction enzyme M protein
MCASVALHAARCWGQSNLIWKIADLMRGAYQPNQDGDVVLPFTILRRLDCTVH